MTHYLITKEQKDAEKYILDNIKIMPSHLTGLLLLLCAFRSEEVNIGNLSFAIIQHIKENPTDKEFQRNKIKELGKLVRELNDKRPFNEELFKELI